MNDSATALIHELRSSGLEFSLWNAAELTELVAADPRLVDRYFHPGWVEAISAGIAASPAVERSGSSTDGETEAML